MQDRKPISSSRIQFTWGYPPDAPSRWLLGVFCFFRRAKSPVTGKYYVPVKSTEIYPLAVWICVRGLLLWSMALALAAYFGIAALLTAWFDHKPFNLITYSDLASPWRWSQLESLRGKANLAQAEADLKAGNLRSAFAYLRSGLARYPHDSKARLQLASLYILFRIRPEAEKTMIEAFDHSYPGLDYIKKAVSLIEPSDNPVFLIAFCDRGRASLAASDSPSVTAVRYLDGVKVKTLLELDRADEAVSLIEKNHPEDLAFLQVAKVAQAFVHSDLPSAEAELNQWLSRMPDSEQALTTAVRIYSAAKKIPELNASILRLRSRYPENHDYIALALAQYLYAGQTSAALDLLDISVIRFAHMPSVYGDWAEAIGKTGSDDVLARLEQLVRETNQNPQAVLLSRLMAQIRTQSWTEAEATSARLDDLYPQVHSRVQALHRVAKALLTTCSQPVKGAQNTLTNTITGGWVAMPLYEKVVDALVASARYDAALEVLTLAEGYFPTSRYIASQRTAITNKLAEQNSALARDNATHSAASAPGIPETADALFSELDALSAAGRADEALRQARAIRKAAPAWLAENSSALDQRELQLAAKANDLPLLQVKLRELLRTDNGKSSAPRIIDHAKTWYGQQLQSAALLALREVIKLRPDDQIALGLLAEWSASRDKSYPSADSPATALPAPPPAAPIPDSAEALFKTLDSPAFATNARESLRLLRAVRDAAPSWLGAALPQIDWREILLAARTDDLSLLQLNLRSYLRSRPSETKRCIAQAKTWHAEGNSSAALIAVRAALRQNPDNTDAQNLLREWESR